MSEQGLLFEGGDHHVYKLRQLPMFHRFNNINHLQILSLSNFELYQLFSNCATEHLMIVIAKM